jgi:pimeloyl-ACP methyl ester carboxylesterase
VHVDGFGLHVMREPGAGHDPLPLLLLLHGWPSSFLQMLKIAPLLADTFEVVVPSLPGYGLSDRPTEPGINVTEAARLVGAAMAKLGYERYAVRASDIGAGVAT